VLQATEKYKQNTNKNEMVLSSMRFFW